MCTQNYFPPGQRKQDINFPLKFTDLILLATYAERVGGGSGAANPADAKALVMACLATNRMTYCKQKLNDCGSPAQVDLGAKAGALKYGGAATGTATGLASLGAFGPGLAAGTAASAALGAATLGIGLVALPLLTIWAHHAQAVAKEQGVLCSVTVSWNGFADAVERALAEGKINIQDATAQLSIVYQQLSGMLQSITKGMNAGGYFQRALDALIPWNKEIVFPASVPQPPPAIAGVAGASGGKNTGLLLTGGGIFAAHALGAF